MDKASLMVYLRDMDDDLVVELIEDMSGHLSEDQFKACVGKVFSKVCPDEADLRYRIEHVIEKVWFDMESSYYDDDSESSLEDIIGYLKDEFYFVKVMFDADLDEEATDLCRRIADCLGKVSEDPKYGKARDILAGQMDEILGCIERGECEKWFEN